MAPACDKESFLAAEILFYLLNGEMIRRLQGADRGAEYFRHPLIFHIVIIFHIEHYALLFREHGHGLAQLAGEIVAVDIFVALNEIDQMALLIVETEAQTLALTRQMRY